jgi:hypothetical protein
MKAELITRFKDIAPTGDIIEMVVWHVPDPVPPTTHRYKYRLVYIVDGERVIGFDNERGKGDHRHWAESEYPYDFTSIDTLIEDFLAEVDKWKSAH